LGIPSKLNETLVVFQEPRCVAGVWQVCGRCVAGVWQMLGKIRIILPTKKHLPYHRFYTYSTHYLYGFFLVTIGSMEPQQIYLALLLEGIAVIRLIIIWFNLVGYHIGYHAGLKIEVFRVQALHGHAEVRAAIATEEAPR